MSDNLKEKKRAWRKKIAQNQLDAVLKDLAETLQKESTLNELSLLQNRYTDLSTKVRLGTISYENQTLTRNQISQTLLAFITQLNASDLEASALPSPAAIPAAEKTDYRLFLSYAHADQVYFDLFKQELLTHTKHAKVKLAKIWSDEEIPVGGQWDDTIRGQMKAVDIAMLLVSANFLNSDYIENVEFKTFLERSRTNELLVFPVYLDPVDFSQYLDLGNIQFFMPRGADFGKPQLEKLGFSDLIIFSPATGMPLPNPNRSRYFIKLVERLEHAIQAWEARRKD